MQDLPIGISGFSELRKTNCVYVDKTKQVYSLLKKNRRTFLSRPRRFGKSLLVSTLEAALQGKKELFKGPLGWILKALGGTPIDRFSKHGMVDQVAALFTAKDNFILGLSPEGTRKRVNTLRTGFYFIAKKAGVPIVPIGFDFENKKVIIGDAFFAGDNEAEDFKKIIAFYSKIKGKVPNFDLRHLKI